MPCPAQSNCRGTCNTHYVWAKGRPETAAHFLLAAAPGKKPAGKSSQLDVLRTQNLALHRELAEVTAERDAARGELAQLRAARAQDTEALRDALGEAERLKGELEAATERAPWIEARAPWIEARAGELAAALAAKTQAEDAGLRWLGLLKQAAKALGVEDLAQVPTAASMRVEDCHAWEETVLEAMDAAEAEGEPHGLPAIVAELKAQAAALSWAADVVELLGAEGAQGLAAAGRRLRLVEARNEELEGVVAQVRAVLPMFGGPT